MKPLSEGQTSRVDQILAAKASAGDDAFLWLHDSGDCILWPDEKSSENDDGKNAVGRWQLNAAEVAELDDSGAVDMHA